MAAPRGRPRISVGSALRASPPPSRWHSASVPPMACRAFRTKIGHYVYRKRCNIMTIVRACAVRGRIVRPRPAPPPWRAMPSGGAGGAGPPFPVRSRVARPGVRFASAPRPPSASPAIPPAPPRAFRPPEAACGRPFWCSASGFQFRSSSCSAGCSLDETRV